MADIFEGNLTLADDWGNVIRDDQPGIPASGSSVQEFIKGYLRETEQKPSAFHALDDVTNNQNILIAFRSDADKKSWLNEWQAEGKDIFSNEALTDSRVLTNVKLQKAKPEPYYQITLENHTETGNTYVSTDGKVTTTMPADFKGTVYCVFSETDTIKWQWGNAYYTWEEFIKAGLVRDCDGIRFCQSARIDESLKFNSLAKFVIVPAPSPITTSLDFNVGSNFFATFSIEPSIYSAQFNSETNSFELIPSIGFSEAA